MKSWTATPALLAACLLATALGAATRLLPGAAVNVSRTPEATEKARLARLAFVAGGLYRKAWLVTYADGPVGAQNVYARHSFDEGMTWSAPLLLSRDGAGAPTGGQSITVRDARVFTADNDKPSLFAATAGAAPAAVITWNSAYCPADPRAGHAGAYAHPGQGAGDADGDGVVEHPFHCVWVATSSDPALASWEVQQLTDGTRDAIGEVVAGNATGTALALAWQEDPAGLQPGEAEGRGDGGTGANVSGGTNIWYTHAPTASGVTLRANVARLSNNALTGTGQPGASRPNLQISGSTAVVAYEETACPGGSGGKCIVHHAFAYAAHDTDAAGTVVSDPARNARRVRLVLQGAANAGSSALRSLLLWRESTPGLPGAPADLMVRRGLADPVARPGSTGFAAADLLAEPAQRLTDVARSGGNINAHRAVMRGDEIALAYDLTPDMAGADPKRTAVPTASYDLFFTRSSAGGAADSWAPARNLSNLGSPAHTVAEPRLVPTPATLVNPLTGVPDAGDQQNEAVLHIAYAVESNSLAAQPERVYVGRSSDRGASFEPFVPVSARTAGQSEAQLRPLPDGSAVAVLWMEQLTPGDAASQEAMFSVLQAVALPDLQLAVADAQVDTGSARTLQITLANTGEGAAHGVVLNGQLPAGLRVVGLGDPAHCALAAGGFRCELPLLARQAPRSFTVTVTGEAEGAFALDVEAASAEPDAAPEDNAARATITAVAAPNEPALPAPLASGGGCTLAPQGAAGDGALPLLALAAVLGLARRRGRREPQR